MSDKLTINKWSEEDRPRERLERLGPQALSDAELLAILVGSGSTKEDAVYHGFGLRSIKSAAEKYGGSMRVRARNGWFSVNLLIPVPAGQDHSG